MYRIKDNVLIGLSKEKVDERVRKGQTNKKENRKTKTYGEIFRHNFFSVFNVVILIMAILVSFTIRSISDISNLTFLLIALVNLGIGIFQEIKAKRVVDKLVLTTMDPVKVLRELDYIEMPPSDIVLDDIIYLDGGHQIPADSIVVSGECYVNESAITGESDDILKKKGDELYSGSYLVSGEIHARVIHVGKDNFIEKLSSEATKYSKPKSEIMSSLNKIITTISISLIPLSILLFWIYLEYSTDSETFKFMFLELPKKVPRDVVLGLVSSINGMIPYGLFLLTSVSLAASVLKLSRERTVVQETYCIEQLARIDTICLDKTGTITDGSMSVEELIPYDSKMAPIEIIQSMNASLKGTNQTSKALKDKYGDKPYYTATNILNFNSTNKFSAVTFKEIGTIALGAPDILLKMKKNSKLYKEIEGYAMRGKRVLALAKSQSNIKENTCEGPFELVALITLQDNIRVGAKETLKKFQDNGVDIKIISGDNPITVSAIAKEAGVPNAEKYISLADLSDADVIDACDKYTVFGRVKPNQKKLLVTTLKSKGHKVAMTGDGVNDILALRESDCSIVMASGSEAVKTVAHIVLLDSNFLSLPKVVNEGRRVINNIERSASLFLSKTFLMILINLMAIVMYFIDPAMKFTGPFKEPSQMMIIETFIIGFPSLILALEPNASIISGKFLRNVFKKALPGALIVFMNALLVHFLYDRFGVSEESLSNLEILVSSFTFFLILVYISIPYSPIRIVVSVSSLLLTLFGVFFTNITYSLKGSALYKLNFFHFNVNSETGMLLMNNKAMMMLVLLTLLAIFYMAILIFFKILKNKIKNKKQNEEASYESL